MAAMTADRVRAQTLADPAGTLLALDFDGTLSPVVDDPASAFIHADSFAALQRLGTTLGAIAIVTGRPVEQARRLGRIDGSTGLDGLVICGQYGAERWDRATGELVTLAAPDAIGELEQRLPGLLAGVGVHDAQLEHKGLAIAVHTRGSAADSDTIVAPLEALALELGLTVEPGREVVEVRMPGSDKGIALHTLLGEDVRRVIFAGDDLGDLPAFRAARALDIDSLLICSHSPEQDALVPLADLVLDGPDGIAAWLTDLADDLGV